MNELTAPLLWNGALCILRVDLVCGISAYHVQYRYLSTRMFVHPCTQLQGMAFVNDNWLSLINQPRYLGGGGINLAIHVVDSEKLSLFFDRNKEHSQYYIVTFTLQTENPLLSGSNAQAQPATGASRRSF